MPESDRPRIVLTRDELRFEIHFALSQAGRHNYREMQMAKEDKRERAYVSLTDKVLARFDRLEVTRPDYGDDWNFYHVGRNGSGKFGPGER